MESFLGKSGVSFWRKSGVSFWGGGRCVPPYKPLRPLLLLHGRQIKLDNSKTTFYAGILNNSFRKPRKKCSKLSRTHLFSMWPAASAPCPPSICRAGFRGGPRPPTNRGPPTKPLIFWLMVSLVILIEDFEINDMYLRPKRHQNAPVSACHSVA